jgi:hypothetical protein
MNFNPEIKPNVLKSEHLKDAPPIMGCIYDWETLKKNPAQKAEFSELFEKFEEKGEDVNFSFRKGDIVSETMLNTGPKTYVISPIDTKDKYSADFLDCTGVVAVGIDKKTGKNISFMSHQNPDFFLNDEEKQIKFRKDLIQKLKELKEQSLPDTIDVAIVGGNEDNTPKKIPDENFRLGIDDETKFLKDKYSNYKESITILNNSIAKVLEFSPVVLTGLNSSTSTESGANNALDIYLDNKNRRLYMVRARQESKYNESFLAKDVDEHISKKIKS